jgi:DNA-binding CsgD family transcriptional regulator
MTYKTRIKYIPEQKADIWSRWEKGESLTLIGRLFDRSSSSIFTMLAPTGGIRPPTRTRSKLALTSSDREDISRCIATGLSLRSIAESIHRSPSTISREIKRYDVYRATHADQAAWDRSQRPKRSKLANNRALSRLVAKKLQRMCFVDRLRPPLYSDVESPTNNRYWFLLNASLRLAIFQNFTNFKTGNTGCRDNIHR